MTPCTRLQNHFIRLQWAIPYLDWVTPPVVEGGGEKSAPLGGAVTEAQAVIRSLGFIQEPVEPHPNRPETAETVFPVWADAPIKFENDLVFLPHVRARFAMQDPEDTRGPLKDPGSVRLTGVPGREEAAFGQAPMPYRRFVLSKSRGGKKRPEPWLKDVVLLILDSKKRPSPGTTAEIVGAVQIREAELTVVSEGIALVAFDMVCLDVDSLDVAKTLSFEEGGAVAGTEGLIAPLQALVADSEQQHPIQRDHLEVMAMRLRRGFSGKPCWVVPVDLRGSRRTMRFRASAPGPCSALAEFLDDGRTGHHLRGARPLKSLRDAILDTVLPIQSDPSRNLSHRHQEPAAMVYAQHDPTVGGEDQFQLAWRLANQFDQSYEAPGRKEMDIGGLALSRPMGNRLWAASRNGASVLANVGGAGDRFTVTSFPKRVRTDYSILFQLVLQQREFLLDLRERTAKVVKTGADLYDQEALGDDRRKRDDQFERILRRKQDFVTHMFAKHASDSLPHAEFYRCVWEGFGMNTLFESTQLAVQELKDRMDREADKAEERAEEARRRLSKALTYLALPATLVSGVLGLNLKEFSLDASPLAIVLAVVFGLLGFGLAWRMNRETP